MKKFAFNPCHAVGRKRIGLPDCLILPRLPDSLLHVFPLGPLLDNAGWNNKGPKISDYVVFCSYCVAATTYFKSKIIRQFMIHKDDLAIDGNDVQDCLDHGSKCTLVPASQPASWPGLAA